MKKIFFPNFLEKTPFKTILTINIVEILIFILYAQFNGNEILPKPLGVLHSLSEILSSSSFYDNFIATFSLIVMGMGISILVSLFFSYLSLTPVFKNIAQFISKLRFLTYTGLIFVFTIVMKDGHSLKIAMLLFGIIPYFVTSFLSYVNDISPKEYKLCYTLKFSRWKILYEVVILGRLHTVLEVIRQNFAIAWMMITSVEGLSMAEGGLGTMMIKSNKYLHVDDVFAVLTIIFLTGILFDYLFGVLKVWMFPYTDTKRYSNLLFVKLFKNKKS